VYGVIRWHDSNVIESKVYNGQYTTISLNVEQTIAISIIGNTRSREHLSD
ncbi:5657_t:CDS:1, partial [Racocetra fulgida]